MRLIVFTDLDGTLLRHEDYAWSPACPALEELRRRHVPLVIASSKTRAEIESWRTRLGIGDPFISENGGGLYVPPDATPRPVSGARPVAGYLCVSFGASYERIREGLTSLSRTLDVPLRGFGDMTAEEVGALTGLAGEEVALAMRREFDEPFVSTRQLSDDEASRLETAAAALGLRVTRGGRFHHLIGPSSKGEAARRLMAAYASNDSPTRSLGLGDGPNDLELLQVVDRPIVVARPDGTHARELVNGLPHAHLAAGIGPAGFNEAVLSYLERPW
jgi:mannosyl-3-phosphoglycerate phosphatase